MNPTTTLDLQPDRWLVCSPNVHDSIVQVWAADTDDHPLSLTQLRVRSGQVEQVDLSAAVARVRALSQDGCGVLHIVVDQMGDAALTLFGQLRELDAVMYWHVWREAPKQVMASLGSPEAVVSDAWRAVGAMPAQMRLQGEWPARWLANYRQALAHWLEQLREDDPVSAADFEPVAGEEVVSVAAMFAALGKAVSASLATVVRLMAQPARELLGGEPASRQRAGAMRGMDPPVSIAHAKTSAPTPPPVRQWQFGDDGRMTLRIAQYYGEPQATVQLVATATAAELASIGYVCARVGGTEVIEFGAPGDPIEWIRMDSGEWITISELDYSLALQAAVTDLATQAELQVGPPPLETADGDPAAP